MLNFGLGELSLVLILALVVVGPDRLPEMVRFLGRQYGKLMRASNELRQAFVLEAERAEAERRAELLKKRRDAARSRADAARAQVRATAMARKKDAASQPEADKTPDEGTADEQSSEEVTDGEQSVEEVTNGEQSAEVPQPSLEKGES